MCILEKIRSGVAVGETEIFWTCEEDIHGCPNVERCERLTMDGVRRYRGRP